MQTSLLSTESYIFRHLNCRKYALISFELQITIGPILYILKQLRNNYKLHHMYLNYIIQLLVTALHGMQRGLNDEISVRLSVCPSVCLSNACIVTKRKKDMFRFLYHTKEHLS